jgi:hypothetical protein
LSAAAPAEPAAPAAADKPAEPVKPATPAKPAAATEPAKPAAPAEPAQPAAAVTPAKPPLRAVQPVAEPETDAIDLMDYAGASVAKRALPVLAGLLALLVIWRVVRSRRS